MRFEWYNCGLFSIFCFLKTMTFVKLIIYFPFLKTKIFYQEVFCFCRNFFFSFIFYWGNVVDNNASAALVLSTSCLRRLLAFLVTSSTPSSSNTRFSSIPILAVSDFIVSSSCGSVFSVTGAVFSAGETVSFFFSCVHFSCG